MIIRKAQANDIDKFLEFASYCFGDPYEDRTVYKETFNLNATTVVEDNGEIVGGYTAYPFEITYGNKTVSMAGISCVVIDVDARYRGYSNEMLSFMIRQMYDNGVVFSALHPFNFEFYRKLGWETAYDNIIFELDTDLLAPYLKADYDMKRYYDIPIDDVIDIQHEYSKKYNGIVVRTKEYWEVYEKYYKMGKFLFGTVRKNDKVCGYIVYKLEGDKIHVRELVYNDIESLKALLGFIYKHNSQKKKTKLAAPIDFPLRLMVGDHYKVKAEVAPLMMNRVVDVKKALELGEYPNIGEYSTSIKVIDKQADWNDGVWHLYLSQGNITAEKGSGDESFDAESSISDLSQMLIGYVSGATLLNLDKIKTHSDEAKYFIENAFLEKTTYMNNRF